MCFGFKYSRKDRWFLFLVTNTEDNVSRRSLLYSPLRIRPNDIISNTWNRKAENWFEQELTTFSHPWLLDSPCSWRRPRSGNVRCPLDASSCGHLCQVFYVLNVRIRVSMCFKFFMLNVLICVLMCFEFVHVKRFDSCFDLFLMFSYVPRLIQTQELQTGARSEQPPSSTLKPRCNALA